RTKFRAEAALVAGRSANAVDLNHGRVVALDKAMRGWQHDDAARGLGHWHVEAGRRLGHHDSAEEHPDVAHRRAARGFDHFADSDADGYPESNGGFNGAGHGEVFVGYRLIQADVDEGLDIGDGYVHILGQAARRNDAAGDQVNENELIACRVDIRQGHNPHSGRHDALQRGNDLVVFFLDSYDCFTRAYYLHG